MADWVFEHLKETYGIDAADLVSAELSLVPATRPRDVGFDRRLTAATAKMTASPRSRA
ncbi:hypothetical protein [Kordiimonas gwangyangensis]|uniref:hypothetical protein n=1 Tax=Kordiimonas gwangyangensis TaxID=288022 RepID=UPI000AAB0615|nr:hypothetical protein [Kordiimonas gwangyangensis]